MHGLENQGALDDFVKIFGSRKPPKNPRFETEHPRSPRGEFIDKTIIRPKKALQLTHAFQVARLRPDMVGETSTHGDYFMAELARDYGFSGHPTKVTEDELRRAVKDGAVRPIWRGVTDATYADRLLNDSYHAGRGFRANGIYVAYGKQGHSLAVGYSHAPRSLGKKSVPTVIHLGLKQQAKVVTYAQIRHEAEVEARRLDKIRLGEVEANKFEKRDAEIQYRIALDPGRFAMAQGYDAMVVDDDEIVVFNRTALMASEIFEDTRATA